MPTKRKPQDAEARQAQRLSDAELSTDAHDAILLWLNEHIVQVIGNMGLRFREDDELVSVGVPPSAEHIATLREEAAETVQRFLERAKAKDEDWLVGRPKPQTLQQLAEWRGLGEVPEHPLVDAKTTLQKPIGSRVFADLYALCHAYTLGLPQKNALLPFSLGHVEKLEWHGHAFSLWFEIELTIPSVGGLIRRLQRCKELAPPNCWIVVVSPDDSQRSVFEEQGFLFFKVAPANRGKSRVRRHGIRAAESET